MKLKHLVTPHFAVAALVLLAIACGLVFATAAAHAATKAPAYVVSAQTAGSKTAPAFYATDAAPSRWAPEYKPATVGEPAEFLTEERRDPLPPINWCLLKSRKGIAAVCEVKK